MSRLHIVNELSKKLRRDAYLAVEVQYAVLRNSTGGCFVAEGGILVIPPTKGDCCFLAPKPTEDIAASEGRTHGNLHSHTQFTGRRTLAPIGGGDVATVFEGLSNEH